MEFHPENFITELEHMGVGMLSIFIVIGVIMLMTIILNRLTRKR